MRKIMFFMLILCAVAAAASGLHAQAKRPPVLRVAAAALQSDVVVYGSRQPDPAAITTVIRSQEADLVAITDGLVTAVQDLRNDDTALEKRLTASFDPRR